MHLTRATTAQSWCDPPPLTLSLARPGLSLHSQAKAKAFTKKCPPDIVLYFDRLDVPTRSDFGDLPLLRTITNTFGAAVWFNAIVVLTHASTAPPDAPNGQPMSYEMYVQQRSHIVQQTIRQAAGDLRLMVSLVPGFLFMIALLTQIFRILLLLPKITQLGARTAKMSQCCRTARSALNILFAARGTDPFRVARFGSRSSCCCASPPRS